MVASGQDLNCSNEFRCCFSLLLLILRKWAKSLFMAELIFFCGRKIGFLWQGKWSVTTFICEGRPDMTSAVDWALKANYLSVISEVLYLIVPWSFVTFVKVIIIRQYSVDSPFITDNSSSRLRANNQGAFYHKHTISCPLRYLCSQMWPFSHKWTTILQTKRTLK